MRKRIVSYLFFIITVVTFNSCSDGGINLFSKADEVQLGREVDAEIRANPQEYPIYNQDPSVKAYINQRIFQHILTSPKIANKSIYEYQIELLDKPEELNAFALPGGYIYIYTGLLKYLDSEAALAGVLGHEIAHAELRHATQRMTAYYGVSFLISLVLGENPSQVAEIATNLLVGLAFLRNSRADENQADQESFQYLRDTRYYPGGVKFFFEQLRDDNLVSSQPSQVETFLSTHPAPVDRISNTNQRLQEAGLPQINHSQSGEGIFREEYRTNIRNKIR
jgi:beta-barrel assembly-enhancing protease